MLFEGETPLACMLMTSSAEETSFLGLPIRLELALDRIPVGSVPKALGLIRDEVQAALGHTNNIIVEIPIENEITNILVESLLPNSSSHNGFAEVVAELDPANSAAKGLSGPHRRNLRKASEALGEPLVWFGHVDSEVFDAFRELHKSAAGRVTRPSSSWDEMMSAIEHGRASLTTVYDSNQLVGGTFCWVSASAAIYATGAYDRSKFSDYPISHLTMVYSMEHARKFGCKNFLVGEAYAPGGSSKEKGIAQFKRGFSQTRKHFHRITVAQ